MSLSDFLTLSKIGTGAFSSVHKVKRVSDGQIYALKKVRMGNLTEKEKQNALNEVRLLASIDSEYVIKYREAFFDLKSTTLCIVMEFADGGDLEKLISKKKENLSWVEEKDVWTVMKQVVSGLNVLHDQNIIHRDIKCANIFISKGVYKLADLNVSKLMKRDLVYTQTGTPYYASPEVWQDKPYELKSDIWSLGCILYELCALKPPFAANTMEGLYRKVLKGEYTRLPSTYSTKLAQAIGSCLQIDPSKRPSCKQLLRMIANGANPEENSSSSINLLSTIKVPRRHSDWKGELPKSDYRDRASEKSVDMEIENKSDRFRHVSQQKLKEIVRNYKVSRVENRDSTETSEIVEPYKGGSRKAILPAISSQKVHSEPNDRVGLLLAKLREEDIKKYNPNRPYWWG